MVTVTPAGITTGILPILDISLPPYSPYKGKHFAANILFASLLVGHDAL